MINDRIDLTLDRDFAGRVEFEDISVDITRKLRVAMRRLRKNRHDQNMDSDEYDRLFLYEDFFGSEMEDQYFDVFHSRPVIPEGYCVRCGARIKFPWEVNDYGFGTLCPRCERNNRIPKDRVPWRSEDSFMITPADIFRSPRWTNVYSDLFESR